MNDSFFGRLKDLITNPGRLMDNVGANRRWWQPGLLIFVSLVGFSWITMPIAAPEQAELMRDSWAMNLMSEEAADQVYEDTRNLSTEKHIIHSFTMGFTNWIAILIFGLVLGFFAKMAGGKGTMSQAVGIVSWGSLPVFLLGPLVKVPFILKTESVFGVNFGLVELVPGLEPGDGLFHFLMIYGDFFSWWGLFLLVIGFERVFGLDHSAAVPSVVLPWALLSLFPLTISLISF